MTTLPPPLRIANTAAVLEGVYGAVTRQATRSGTSRQALYRVVPPSSAAPAVAAAAVVAVAAAAAAVVAVVVAAVVPTGTGVDAVVPPGAEPEKVAGGCRFTEGPAADADGNVFFTDSPRNRIMVLRPGG